MTGGSLSGKLSAVGCLSGNVSVPRQYEEYGGSYLVTPQTSGAQVLETAGKLLAEDVTVSAVPYSETANLSGGTTAYIGEGGN